MRNPYGSGRFANPFFTESTDLIPTGINTSVWDLAGYLWTLNRQYAAAMSSVGTYFLTDIEFVNTSKTGDEGEQRWLREYLHDHVQFFSHHGKKVSDEWACFDNSITQPLHPFRRVLVDTRHGYSEWSINQLKQLGEVKFIPERMMYEVCDPRTASYATAKRSRIQLPFSDTYTNNEDDLKFTTLDIRDMYCDVSLGYRNERIRRLFPSDHTAAIRRGDPFFVSDLPKVLIQGSLTNSAYEYKEGQVFHFKSPMLAGILRYCGFGVPQSILCFRDIYHLQVLKRANEVICQDMVVPLRVVSPQTSAGADRGVDPQMGVMGAALASMVRNHRSNPYSIHAAPFAVQGQNLFADERELVPIDSLNLASTNLMRALRVPEELYMSTMKANLDPRVLRLFNSTYAHVYANLNALLKYIVDIVYSYRKEDKPNVRLKHPSVADDIEIKQIIMQMHAANKISGDTAFKALGINASPVAEAVRTMEETISIDQEKKRLETQVAAEQQLEALQQQVAASGQSAPGETTGQSSSGGAPSAVPAGVSADPAALQALGEQTAKRWVQMDESSRTKDMQALASSNFNLYSIAKEIMEQLRRGAESQGRAQVGAMVQQEQQQQQAAQ